MYYYNNTGKRGEAKDLRRDNVEIDLTGLMMQLIKLNLLSGLPLNT